ncbi:histidine phosphatase family protein [soil metagenome]
MGLQLIVVRHGETEWSRTGKHTGLTDIPLTEQGRAEALLAAETLQGWTLARAYTSPLIRAKETAEVVAPECGVEVDSSLVEWDYGRYEGESTAETRKTIPDWSVWTHEIHDGESIEEVGARADVFLGRVNTEVENGNAVVFAHGHLLAILIARWCGLDPADGRHFPLATATASLLGSHRDDPVIRTLNHRVGSVLNPPTRT